MAPPPIFGRSVNPIPTGEGRLSTLITSGPSNIFHLPASLYTRSESYYYITSFTHLPIFSIFPIKNLIFSSLFFFRWTWGWLSNFCCCSWLRLYVWWQRRWHVRRCRGPLSGNFRFLWKNMFYGCHHYFYFPIPEALWNCMLRQGPMIRVCRSLGAIKD